MSASSAFYLRALAAAGAPIVGTPGPDILEGTSGDDEINGRGGDDILRGLAGNDSLDGWAGADRMEGGTGDDTYFVDNLGDVVVEAAGAHGGIDLVNAAVDFTLGTGVENLRLWGAARTGIGNELANVITGNSQANALAGGGGSDTLDGGAGDDFLYYGDLPARQLYLQPGDSLHDDGADTLIGGAGIDTYVVPTWLADDGGWEETWYESFSVRADLGAGTVSYGRADVSADRLVSIENIVTGSADDVVDGSAGANRIEVGGGHNVARGLGGADVLVGGHSWDVYEARETEILDRLYGGAGSDVLDSGGSYWEYGTARSFDAGLKTDFLSGGGGADRLIGGIGHVTMTGGGGADQFEARSDTYEFHDYIGPSTGAAAASVTITDFNPGAGDRILFNRGIGSVTWDGDVRQALPDWVGRTQALDFDEIGYRRVTNADGGTDTIITQRYLYHSDFGWDDDGLNVDLEFQIVLKDFSGRFEESWITFV